MRALLDPVGRFSRRDDGAATVSFAILFPVVVALLMMGLEVGYYMARTVMLDHALETSVRRIRLGEDVPDADRIRADICAASVILGDCGRNIRVSVDPVEMPSGAGPDLVGRIDCRDDAGAPATPSYRTGDGNAFVVARACVTARPFFPTSGFGAGMRRTDDGHYAVIAVTGWVNEPEAVPRFRPSDPGAYAPRYNAPGTEDDASGADPDESGPPTPLEPTEQG